MKTRDTALDRLKGIAITAVVLGHVLLGLHGELPGVIRWLYSFHMSLFFFVAGMLSRSESFGNLIKDKGRRLLLPYFTIGILHLSLNLIFNASTNHHATPAQVWQLFYLPYGHLWYLFSLFFIFLLAQLLRNTISSVKSGLILMIIFSLSSYWFNYSIFTISDILFFMVYFYYGMYFKKIHRPAIISNLAPILFALLAIFFLTQNLQGLNAHLLKLFSGFVAIETFYAFKSGKAFEWLGFYSYDIYLLHVWFTAGTRILLWKLNITNLPLQIAAGLVLGIAGPYLIFKYLIRPLPLLRLLFLGEKIRS